MNKDKQMIDIILKRTEDLINKNTQFLISRLKIYLHVTADAKERNQNFRLSGVAEPEAQYISANMDSQEKQNADSVFSQLCNALDMDNMIAVESAKEDLAKLGIIHSKDYPDSSNIQKDL